MTNKIIKDSGGGHLENSKKCNISATERPILTKFVTVMRVGPADTNSKYKFTISIIQNGGGRHLEKSNNLNIFATD